MTTTKWLFKQIKCLIVKIYTHRCVRFTTEQGRVVFHEQSLNTSEFENKTSDDHNADDENMADPAALSVSTQERLMIRIKLN